MANISVVINALNAALYLETALTSVQWADEIVVVDDGSTDDTIKIAKKYTNKIYKHKSVGFVEPARNLAISKASGDWILILDTDEEISSELAKRLRDISKNLEQINYVEIPRKNIIFNKWMKASMWWPDYNIRFFRKGAVKWSNKIHRPPDVAGEGMKLELKEELAITHHHYRTINEFVERLNRYTTIQANELIENGYKFSWSDLLTKPLSEFLSRFFANRGFEDGLHGLSLSLLQAFSFLIMYLKVWEKEKFFSKEIDLTELRQLKKKSGEDLDYWFKYGNLSKNPLKRFVQKVANRVK
ncbi:MAG: glycosyltransferase family 2 protein [Candidatus Daviesbacteria bacterium]|nr:MAG: glycosyltransferase family 2 protein [Candidatus Daviesbacteria bacterium]